MLKVTEQDGALIKKGQRYAFIAWLCALLLGVASWGARAFELHGAASLLMTGVWIAGAVFVLCWLFLAVSMLLLFISQFGRRGDA